MRFLLWYCCAALLEIAGCFSFWAWLRLHKSAWWIAPGMLSLIGFALALTRIETPVAGRAYAAYGGIYILCSLLWLWTVEGTRPDAWDLLGAGICVAGAAVIVLAPRSA